MGYKYNIPKYNILSNKELEEISEISLDILEKIGMKLPHNKVLEVLYSNGCKVDKKTKITKFPKDIVLKSIKSASKKHIIYGRNKNNKAEFGYNMFNFNGSSGQYQILDQRILKRRKPTIMDLQKAVRIGDALKYINIVGAMVVPCDVPPEIADIIMFYELLVNTSKPFTSWIFSSESAKIIIEMMQIVAGGKEKLIEYPFCEIYFEPISPLTFTKEALDILLEFTKFNLPLGFSPMVQVGATGPCSLSGTIAQENAEILAGITIAQIINPGNPVTYGGIPHVFDMKKQMISFGSPEQALMAASMTELGKFYGFPVYNNTGMSDSKLIDAQCGIEKACTLTFGALSRGDVFGHLGISGSDDAANLTQLLIDNEMAGYFVRIFSGFDVNEVKDAYKEIKKEGIAGNFFANEMTIKNFKKEIWYPELFERAPWGIWEKNGSKDIVKKAIEKEEEIISEHKVLPINESVSKELKKILKMKGVYV